MFAGGTGYLGRHTVWYEQPCGMIEKDGRARGEQRVMFTSGAKKGSFLHRGGVGYEPHTMRWSISSKLHSLT